MRQDRPPSSWQRPPAPGAPGRGGPAPDEPARFDALRWVRRFGMVLLIGMALGMMALPWPWPLLSGVVSLAAVGVGVVALVKVRSARLRRGLTPMLAIGIVLATVLGLASLSQIVLWRENAAYSACVRGAVTVQARDACTAELEKTLNERVRWMERIVQPSA